MKKLALVLICSAIACTASAAEMYRWVDKDGKVHYSDSPPPASAKKVEQKNIGAGSTVSSDDMPYTTRMAAKNFPVTLYTSDCGEPCKLARQHLTNRGIPFSERHPLTDKADSEALKKLVGSLQVPVLLVGNTSPLKGYEAGSWDAALDAAGYPKSKPYGYKEPKPADTGKKEQPDTSKTETAK